jgi:probable rRNA maturation factor
VIEINNQTKYKINEESIKKAILTTLNYLNKPEDWDISVAIVTSSEIQELNKKYRGKDSSTDVLSFPMGEDNILGDIIICYEKAEQQAGELEQSIEKELAFLSTHSTLHLLGYDHMTEADEEIMLDNQRAIMELL